MYFSPFTNEDMNNFLTIDTSKIIMIKILTHVDCVPN